MLFSKDPMPDWRNLSDADLAKEVANANKRYFRRSFLAFPVAALIVGASVGIFAGAAALLTLAPVSFFACLGGTCGFFGARAFTNSHRYLDWEKPDSLRAAENETERRKAFAKTVRDAGHRAAQYAVRPLRRGKQRPKVRALRFVFNVAITAPITVYRPLRYKAGGPAPQTP